MDPAYLLGNLTTEGFNWTTLRTNSQNVEDEDYDSYYDNQYILPWWRQLLWSVLFSGMIVVGIGGNLIVIWIVLTHKRMRTVTNYFLLNLSIADAMIYTFNVIFNFIFMLNNHWPFGVLYCKIAQFVATLSVCASVFSLMAISIDRYMAIMTPLRPRMGRRLTLCISISTWIFGSAFSSPNLLYFTTGNVTSSRIMCYLEWPDGPTSKSTYEFIYNVFLLFTSYILPIVAMTYTYAKIGVELWGSQSIGECTQRQIENVKSKRKVVKMMIVVVIIFAVCWLPYNLYFVVLYFWPDISGYQGMQEIFLFIYWLAMSNSMYNPIIYCWMNARFRRCFKQFFSCCPFVNLNNESLTRREVLTSKHSCSGSPDHHRIIKNGSVRVPLQPLFASPSPTTTSYIEAGDVSVHYNRAGSRKYRDSQI